MDFAYLEVYTKNGTYFHYWKILVNMEKCSIFGTYLQKWYILPYLEKFYNYNFYFQTFPFMEKFTIFVNICKFCKNILNMVHTYNYGKICKYGKFYHNCKIILSDLTLPLFYNYGKTYSLVIICKLWYNRLE